MKKISLLFTGALAAFTATNLHAQSAPQTVVASAGDFATFSGGSMTWTLGEVMTETYTGPGNFFTQGFNQPDTMYVTVISEPTAQSINVFPNPVVEHLVVDLSQSNGTHLIEVFDMQGNLLKKESVPANKSRVDISFCELANGVYLLNVTNISAQSRSSYRINKAQ